MVSGIDPAGMIPGFVKTKIASFAANAGLLMADYLKDGTVPAPFF